MITIIRGYANGVAAGQAASHSGILFD